MKKLIIFGLVLVLLAVSVWGSNSSYPYATNPLNANQGWNFTSSGVSALGNVDATVNGCSYDGDSPFVEGNSLSCAGDSSNYLDTNWNNYTTQKGFSFSYWVKGVPAAGSVIWGARDAGKLMLFETTIHLIQSNNYWGRIYVSDSVNTDQRNPQYQGSPNVFNASLWRHHVYVHETGNGYDKIRLFVDGVETLYETNTSGNPNNVTLRDLFFMCRNKDGGADTCTGAMKIDDLYFFDRALEIGEIQTLYEGNFTGGGPPPAASTGAYNVTIQVPINDSTFGAEQITGNNSMIWINGTHNGTSEVTCTINETGWSAGSNLTHNFTFYNNTALSAGDNHFEVFCGNSTHNGTATVLFYVDIVYPAIEDNWNNQTTVYDQNLTGQFNFTDDYSLWSFNISIDGTTIENKSNIVSTTYNYNLSYDVSSFGFGEHTLRMEIADGHTATKIKPYKVKYGMFDQYIEYEKDGKKIKISAGLLDNWATEKLVDRYTFEYTPFKKDKSHTFTIESNTKISVIDAPNTKWKKWLIIGDQWLDFYIPSETYTLYIEKVNNKKVKVTVESDNFKDKEKIKFNSIGDLNILVKEYTFNTINITTSKETQLLERGVGTYTLDIIKNNATINSSVDFIFDGSYYSTSKVSDWYSDNYTINYNLPIVTNNNQTYGFNWTLNYTGGGTNNLQLNDTSQVFEIALGECNASFNTTALNFTVNDANTGASVLGYSYESLLTIWHEENTSYTKEFGFSKTDRNISNDICMIPHFANLKTNYDSLFSHTLFDDTHYIVANGNLNATLQTIPILLVNSSLATGVTITIIDQTGQPLSGYIIEAARYNLAENSYTLVTTQTSAGNGQALFYLDVTTYEYRFTVKDSGGNTVYVEPKQKLINTEYTFKIPIGSAPEIVVGALYSLDYELDADRPTKTFTLTWDNINYATSRINLTVLRYNSTNGSKEVSTQSSTANTGTLSYVIVDSTENKSITYTAKVYMVSSNDGNEYYITSETLDFKEEWEVFGTESLVMTFIFIGVMIFIGAAVSPILAIILCIFSMIILWWLGFYIVSLSSLVGIFISLIMIVVKLKR